MSPALPPEHYTGIVLILRTNYADDAVLALIKELRRQTDYPLCIAADDAGREIPPIAGTFHVPLRAEDYRALGLFVPHNVMWRCGDYVFYQVMQLFPNASHFWMIEPDVRIKADPLSSFFDFFDRLRHIDFLACMFGKTGHWWWWHRSMAPYADTVFKCLFPITRLSQKSVRFLFGQRLALSQRFVATHGGREKDDVAPWPNDEAFVATSLADGAFVCHDFNDFGRIFHTGATFGLTQVISLKELDKTPANGLIYHPVYTGTAYEQRLRRLLKEMAYNGETGWQERFLFNPEVIRQLQAECGNEAAERLVADFELTARAVTPRGASEEFSALKAEGSVVSVLINRTRINFFIADRQDYIQTYQWRGQFYEAEELTLIAQHVPRGIRCLDVGAHTGNHTLYFAKFLEAQSVIPVEPNPTLCNVLRTLCAINGIEPMVDLSLLDCAFASVPGAGIMHVDGGNTGTGRVELVADGSVRVVTGDAALAGAAVDFIKIDVGGSMEIKVLQGLQNTLQTCRPQLFIQVPDWTRAEITGFLSPLGYEQVTSYRRYGDSEGILFGVSPGAIDG